MQSLLSAQLTEIDRQSEAYTASIWEAMETAREERARIAVIADALAVVETDLRRFVTDHGTGLAVRVGDGNRDEFAALQERRTVCWTSYLEALNEASRTATRLLGINEQLDLLWVRKNRLSTEGEAARPA